MTHIQQMKATQENFNKVTNLMHAVAHEWNRIAYQLYEARKGNLNP
jgi:hypothetical protein